MAVRENFREDIIPPYCINAYDQFSFKPPPENIWGETDKTYQLAGNREAGKFLAIGQTGSPSRLDWFDHHGEGVRQRLLCW